MLISTSSYHQPWGNISPHVNIMPQNYQSPRFIVVHARFVITYISNHSCNIHVRSCHSHPSSHMSPPHHIYIYIYIYIYLYIYIYIFKPIIPSCNNLINHMPTIQNGKEYQIRQHPRPAPRSSREVSLRRESLSLRRNLIA